MFSKKFISKTVGLLYNESNKDAFFSGIYFRVTEGLPLLLGIYWHFSIYDAAIRSEQPAGLPHSLALADFCQKWGEWQDQSRDVDHLTNALSQMKIYFRS